MKVVIFYIVDSICVDIYLGLRQENSLHCCQSPDHNCRLGKLCS